MESNVRPTMELVEEREGLLTPGVEAPHHGCSSHVAKVVLGASMAALAGALSLLCFHNAPERRARGSSEAVSLPSLSSPLAAADLPSSRPYQTEEGGVGCMNSGSIAMGQSTHGESPESCGRRCSTTAGCVGFGFQAQADCAGEGTGRNGSCSLWSGRCVYTLNSCWDQFGLASERHAAPASPHRASTYVSVKSRVKRDEEPGIGCANYVDIAIGEPLHVESMEYCDQLCQNTTGCVGFGFQANASCEGYGIEQDRVCWLWKDECKGVVNPCWDQYGPVYSYRMAKEKEPGIGCANYADIAIGEPLPHVESEEHCDQLCQNATGCVGFGFQASASCDGYGIEQDRVCWLWKGECQRAVNPCWDQYGPAYSHQIAKDMESGIGCANHVDIAIGEPLLHVGAAEHCDLLCQNTTGCVGFGFQANASCGGDGSSHGGLCYLWKDACARQVSPCWDQYGPAFSYQIAREKEPGIGCANRADIAIGEPMMVDSMKHCDRLCQDTAGCVGFGLQAHASCDGEGTNEVNGTNHANTCHLWKGGCVRQVNPCWDQHGPALSRLADKEPGMGCANYADIAIGTPSQVESVEHCDQLCQRTTGCVGFNFQAHASCDLDGTSQGNACQLWRNECVRRADPCWDQYGEASKDPAITTTTNMHHQVSLYCWLAFKLGTYEVDLVENQFKRQMGIFNQECNENALLTDGEFRIEADGRRIEAISMGPGSMDCEKGPGGSYSNTEIFKRAWQTAIDQHRYQLYDWVIKVDADTVFRPLRFKWHVDANHLGLNPDERIFFKNFMDGYPVVGAIEAASREVVAAMEQDPPGCGSIQVPAEDDWFHRCMEHHGARMVHDATLLQHEDYPGGPDRCADPWFVAIHPHKDVSAMNACDDAIR